MSFGTDCGNSCHLELIVGTSVSFGTSSRQLELIVGISVLFWTDCGTPVSFGTDYGNSHVIWN